MALIDGFIPGVYEYKEGKKQPVRVTITSDLLQALIDRYKLYSKVRSGVRHLKRVVV